MGMLGQHSSAALLKAAVCVLPSLELDLHYSKNLISLGCLETQFLYLLCVMESFRGQLLQYPGT